MQGRHDGNFESGGHPVNFPVATQAKDAFRRAGECLARRTAKCNQNFRRSKLDLSLNEWPTEFRLKWRRRAVARWTPRDRVGDINAFSLQPDGFDHAIEKLAGFSDKR